MPRPGLRFNALALLRPPPHLSEAKLHPVFKRERGRLVCETAVADEQRVVAKRSVSFVVAGVVHVPTQDVTKTHCGKGATYWVRFTT